MKARTPSLPAWPFGVEVQATSEGLLLKPRRKPREGWAKALRSSKTTGKDELADARQARNHFDEKEWQW
jgi:hypothetical protein